MAAAAAAAAVRQVQAETVPEAPPVFAATPAVYESDPILVNAPAPARAQKTSPKKSSEAFRTTFLPRP